MELRESRVESVIVGAGIAGLSAALFLSRAGRSTVVYDAGSSRILAAERVREFLGFDGWTPHEMLRKAREEVLHYGGTIHEATVERIEPRRDGLFDVWTTSGGITTSTVVLATGLVDVLPPLKDLPEVWGRDLRVCPCFNGHEVREWAFRRFWPAGTARATRFFCFHVVS